MLTGLILYSLAAMIGWVAFVYAYFPPYMRYSMFFLTPAAPLLLPLVGIVSLIGFVINPR